MEPEAVVEYRVSWEQYDALYPDLRLSLIRHFAGGTRVMLPSIQLGPVKNRRDQAGFTLYREERP